MPQQSLCHRLGSYREAYASSKFQVVHFHTETCQPDKNMNTKKTPIQRGTPVLRSGPLAT